MTKNNSFLKEIDFTKEELNGLIDLGLKLLLFLKRVAHVHGLHLQ